MSTHTFKDTASLVLAAGAVLWRESDTGGTEIAVIHRPRYDDWSLPKGKLDPGETQAGAAVREIEEETGFASRLGRHLMRVSYPVGKKQRKVVSYWTAQALDGTFTHNNEVDRLEWLPITAARKRLTYTLDRKVLARFAALPSNTRTVLLLRHALAGRRDRYTGNDLERPLDARGRTQATSLVPQLQAFGVERIVTAHPVRCTETVTPLALRLGLEPEVSTAFSEVVFEKHPEGARRQLLELLSSPQVPVICSQGGVIPPLMKWLSERHGFALPPARNRKGSTWVLTVSPEGRCLAADHLDPPDR